MRLTTRCPGLEGLTATGAHAHCDMGGCVALDRRTCRHHQEAVRQFWDQPIPFLGNDAPELVEEPVTNHPYDWFEPMDLVAMAILFFGGGLGIALGLYRTGLYRAIPFF